jgi:hypothetical protein
MPAATTTHKFSNIYTSSSSTALPGNPSETDASSGLSRRGVSLGRCADACYATAGCVLFMYGSVGWCSSCCWLHTELDYATTSTAFGVDIHLGTAGELDQAPQAEGSCICV